MSQSEADSRLRVFCPNLREKSEALVVSEKTDFHPSDLGKAKKRRKRRTCFSHCRSVLGRKGG